jgi:hypothetical protein
LLAQRQLDTKTTINMAAVTDKKSDDVGKMSLLVSLGELLSDGGCTIVSVMVVCVG